MRTIRNLVSIMAFLVLASVVGTCALCGKAVHDVSEKRKAERQEVASPTQTVVNVTSDQLHKDYAANEVRADDAYRGKVLLVTGAVQSINKDIMDNPYLVIWTTNQFEGVQAEFSSAGALSSISIGDHIAVRCLGAGKIIGSPMLRNCILQ